MIEIVIVGVCVKSKYISNQLKVDHSSPANDFMQYRLLVSSNQCFRVTQTINQSKLTMFYRSIVIFVDRLKCL